MSDVRVKPGDLKPEGPASDDMKRIVFEAIGEASMCWSETPAGIFESTRAKAIGENVMKAIAPYIHQAEEKVREADKEAIEKARATAGEEAAKIAKQHSATCHGITHGDCAETICDSIRRRFGIWERKG